MTVEINTRRSWLVANFAFQESLASSTVKRWQAVLTHSIARKWCTQFAVIKKHQTTQSSTPFKRSCMLQRPATLTNSKASRPNCQTMKDTQQYSKSWWMIRRLSSTLKAVRCSLVWDIGASSNSHYCFKGSRRKGRHPTVSSELFIIRSKSHLHLTYQRFCRRSSSSSVITKSLRF